ncbi:DUF4224 domain-containing protein [Pandoraea terrae]|uniref:DUF4224 domain-containing protein n=1 Tax=Pandoraea terrae TaxID=1537710 RepID=UPI00124062C8|nr:DUF4224 domain-containing protein [Pandoraea terrae]
MSQTFLTCDEVKELTGRVKYKTQAHVLSPLGIEHKVRPDGSMLVLRAHMEHVLGGGGPQSCSRRSTDRAGHHRQQKTQKSSDLPQARKLGQGFG